MVRSSRLLKELIISGVRKILKFGGEAGGSDSDQNKNNKKIKKCNNNFYLKHDSFIFKSV